MGLYRSLILPRLIDCACGMEMVTHQRRKIVPRASGRVLDVGVGSGPNLALFDGAHVSEVVGVDPDAVLIARARERARAQPYRVELLETGAEDPRLPAASFDTVVAAYTLCSIAPIEQVLANLRRVLKPGGRLLFCEHSAAPDPKVRRLQDRLAPLWLRLAGGCHLNRDTVEVLERNGFAIDEVDRFYLAHAPRFVGYHAIGSARVR